VNEFGSKKGKRRRKNSESSALIYPKRSLFEVGVTHFEVEAGATQLTIKKEDFQREMAATSKKSVWLRCCLYR